MGGANSGEYKLIAEVIRDGKKLRAEIKVALLDAPRAVVTLDNWDDRDPESFTEFTLAAGTFLPSIDARNIAEESDFSIFTDVSRDYPFFDHANSLCIYNQVVENVGILLTSKSDNFFNTAGDNFGTPMFNNGNNEPSYGCVPETAFDHFARNSVSAAGRSSIEVYTNIDDVSQVPIQTDSAKLASTTRNLGFNRLEAAFNQAITDSNCSNPDVDIYLIPNGLYNPVSAGHISASGAEYPKETVLIFDGGTNTVNEVIRGKVHMIFKGGGNTTFYGNIATVGNVIVHGSGTALTFSGYLSPPRKIAGDLYVFPTDYTNPPKLVVWNSMFYKSIDMGNFIGIDRLGQIAYRVECVGKTRNNNLYSPPYLSGYESGLPGRVLIFWALVAHTKRMPLLNLVATTGPIKVKTCFVFARGKTLKVKCAILFSLGIKPLLVGIIGIGGRNNCNPIFSVSGKTGKFHDDRFLI